MSFSHGVIITRSPVGWKRMLVVWAGVALIVSNEPAQAAPRTAKARAATDSGTLYGAREDVVDFARRTATVNDLDARWVRRQLAGAKRLAAVQRLIMPPPAGTAKNWGAYRDRFLTSQRAQAGVEFWQQNERWLQAAQARWGVPPEVIVGIVGVETFYGRIMGTFRVLDALATLSFDFPSGRSDRSEFFREQLTELLVLAHRQKTDPAAWRGSYAGAMGLPQFMPGNVNRLAVDFDEDGRIDLYASAADVIGSVAHFLADAGWVSDLPARYEVQLPPEDLDLATLLAPDIRPSFTAAQLRAQGLKIQGMEEAAAGSDGLLALVELQMGEAPAVYVAGTQNFWVLSRYNRSSYYVMAVLALGEEVKRRRLQLRSVKGLATVDGANIADAAPARKEPVARCKPRTGRCAQA